MPFEFHLQSGKVSIPKFSIEFAWEFTEKQLHQVVVDTLSYLRGSSKLQLNASNQNCQEIQQLFKKYGQQLCVSLLRHAQADLVNESLVFTIQDPHLQTLPLELLHDGKSYYALSKGIARSLGSLPAGTWQLSSKLGIALLSANPELPKHKSKPDFGYAVPYMLEDWALPKIQNLEWHLHLELSTDNLTEVLQLGPQIILASLLVEQQNWLLVDDNQGYKEFSPSQQQVFLKTAVTHGLELLVLNSLALNSNSVSPAEILLPTGLPYLILINARLGRERIRVYLHELWLRLSAHESIIAAHRHALQALVKDQPLYWDWTMVELHINHDPHINNTTSHSRWSAVPRRPFQPSLLNSEPFIGSRAQFLSVQQWLKKPTPALWLKTKDPNQALNTLLSALRQSVSADLWQLNFFPFNLLLEHFVDSKTDADFSWLLNAVRQSSAALLPLLQPWAGGSSAEKRLVLVFGPLSHESLHWLFSLLGEGFHLVIIHHHLNWHAEKDYLKTLPIETRAENLYKHLEQPVPELWQKFLFKKPAWALQWSFLRRMFIQFPSAPPDWVKETKNLNQAHQKLDQCLELSQLSMQLLAFCFLMEPRVKASFLAELSQQNCDATLKELCNLGLLESSLGGLWVHMPHTVRQRWQTTPWFELSALQTLADRLLRHLLAHTQKSPAEHWHSQLFFSTVVQLAKQDLFDLASDRLLQWVKQNPLDRNIEGYVLYLLLNFAESSQADDSRLRLVHWAKDNLLNRWNVELGAVFCKQAFIWVENAAAWELYARLQTQLANLHLQAGNVEDAARWLSSASQMVLELPKAKGFYAAILDIIFLLIELGDTKKVNQIIALVDFDLKNIKPEELRLFWLLDGYLNQQQGKIEEAINAFNKGKLAKIETESATADFFAYESLIHLLQSSGQIKIALPLRQNLALAYAKYQPKKATVHHQWLYQYHEQQKNYTEAIEHLRWLLEHGVDQDTEIKQKRAHSLGWLYHKLGELEQSVRFYKLAEQTEMEVRPNG